MICDCGGDVIRNGNSRTLCKSCGKTAGVESFNVPVGHGLVAATVQEDANGIVTRRWIKTKVDKAHSRRAAEAALEAISQSIAPAPYIPAPKHGNADLCNVYIVTDYHLGMLAWGDETGADWDTAIAEALLVRWFQSAISAAPDSERAVFAQLGDFLHWDGMIPETPTSKHVLDADTRFDRLVQVTIRVLRRVMDMLLLKHKYIHVIMAEGNHDESSSIWLRRWFRALYEDNPRVEVEIRPDPYYSYEFGRTSVFFHHGHKRTPKNVDHVLVSKFREIYGRTKHSYAHLGHMHHIDAKETNLMVVEQHRTLAAPDAYASRGGWSSGRDACVITYHREYGEVSRLRISADMVAS